MCVCPSYSQTSYNYYPVFFSSFSQSKYLISPSYIPEKEKLELASNYRSLFGAFKKIATYSFSAARIFELSKNKRHAFRLNFYNEKEGSYINSPRFSANYALELPLTSQWKLTTGISIGLAGVYYSVPTIDEKSGMLPDGSLGIGTTYKNWEAHINSSQIFNASQNYRSLKLSRYYQTIVVKKIPINESWQSKTQLVFRFLPESKNDTQLGTGICYKQIFEFGSTYKLNSGLSFYTLYDLCYDNDLIKVYIFYNSSAFKLNPKWQNSIELGFSYRLKDKLDKKSEE